MVFDVFNVGSVGHLAVAEFGAELLVVGAAAAGEAEDLANEAAYVKEIEILGLLDV